MKQPRHRRAPEDRAARRALAHPLIASYQPQPRTSSEQSNARQNRRADRARSGRCVALVIGATLGAQACSESSGSGKTPISMDAAGSADASGGAGPDAPPGASGGAGGAPVSGTGGGSSGTGGGSSGTGGGGGDGSGGDSGGSDFDSGADASAADAAPPDSGGSDPDPVTFAAGLHELFLHDACTGANPSQPDTCLHARELEREVAFGGETGTVYNVTLRVRGLFEPTTINGGQTPLPEHPYFKIGGSVAAQDYSQWHIQVSDPPQTYWLNHYPSTSHTIFQEDFQATLQIAGGASVAVRVVDGNDRQINNAAQGLPDRRQLIAGVTEEVLDGQMLRLDVVSVEAQ